MYENVSKVLIINISGYVSNVMALKYISQTFISPDLYGLLHSRGSDSLCSQMNAALCGITYIDRFMIIQQLGPSYRQTKLIKYVCCTKMTNNDNVESSLLTSILLNIHNLYKFCYKLHISSCRWTEL